MQASLFENTQSPQQCQKHQLGESTITEYPFAFTEQLAKSYLELLISNIDWQQDRLRIAGKEIPVPRLQCWMGDKASDYSYSGLRLKPQPWQPPVLDIRSKVEEIAGLTFNSALLNFYRNGQDSVAWHADDEIELGCSPIIVSVSIGADRIFELKPKQSLKRQKYQILLKSGSILIMGNTLQNNYLHQLPKVKGLNEPRVNLTFRNIV
jgi:alkylated DNA repair dioxygenase AlkB